MRLPHFVGRMEEERSPQFTAVMSTRDATFNACHRPLCLLASHPATPSRTARRVTQHDLFSSHTS
jgi:hypothetical protein